MGLTGQSRQARQSNRAVEAVEAVERLVCRGEGTVTAEEVRATAGARTRILERL